MPRYHTPFSILLLWALAIVPGAQAQQAGAGKAEPTVVEISALRNPVTLPYKPFYAAAKKFEQLHYLDRQSTLTFAVLLRNVDLAENDKTLGLFGDKIAMAIAFDAQGHFQLPLNEQALAENAVLELNRRAGPTRVIYDISSARENLIMGQARLMCEVNLAYVRALSLAMRLANALADCVTVQVALPDNMTGALLRHGERQIVLPIRPALLLRPPQIVLPAGDASWPDDSEIIYVAQEKKVETLP